jgi:chromosome segregation ATPase
MKKKMKEKVELLRVQEQKLTSKDREANELKCRVENLEQELNVAKQKMHDMELELNDTKQKMDDAKHKIENNQQVIAWLNKQASSSSRETLAINTPAVGNTSSTSSLSRYLPQQSMITPDPSLLHPQPTPFISRRPV